MSPLVSRQGGIKGSGCLVGSWSDVLGRHDEAGHQRLAESHERKGFERVRVELHQGFFGTALFGLLPANLIEEDGRGHRGHQAALVDLL
jgi:hypothetical protein